VTEKGEKEMATTTATPSRTTTIRAFPLKYFVLAFAFTWALWVPAALEAQGLIPPLPVPAGFLAVFGPMVAAIVVTAQEDGRAGLRSLLGRVVRWRVAPIWYAVAILGPPALTLGAIGLHVILGGPPPSPGLMIGAFPTLVIYVAYMTLTVALGEEVGWRGYALPALQARYSALVASLILGVLWALWHLPVFFNPDTLYSNLPFFLWLVYAVPVAVLITWVFNSAGGSVLMAILAHAALNASSELWKTIPEYSVRPATTAEAVAFNVHVNLMGAIVLWVAAVVVVLVYGATNLSRRPRQELAASSESQTRAR
jgi:membrane protease YdiL (CAAX protease family)